MSRELKRLLIADDKLIGETRDPLAALFRQILIDGKVTLIDFDRYVNKYIDDPKNGIKDKDNPKVRCTERGNIIQEILRPNMTWKVFAKNLRILPIVRGKFIIELEWELGITTHHAVNVNLSDDVDA